MGGTIDAHCGLEYSNQKNELYLLNHLFIYALGEVRLWETNSGFSGDLKCISIGKQIQGLDSHVCEALYSIFILLYMYAKSLQLCPTLCDPMDHNLPGSSVQARILEWVAVLSSRGSCLSRDWTRVSYVSCLVGGFLYHWHHLGSPHYCFTLTHKIVYMMNRSRE